MNLLRTCLLLAATLSLPGCLDFSVSSDLSTRAGVDLCPDLCAAKARAGCAGFSTSACVSECERVYRAYPSCSAQIDVALRCVSASQYTCEGGRPTTRACTAEASAFASCLDTRAR